MKSYPSALQDIVDFFEPLAEADRREALIAYALNATQHAPRDDETYEVSDVRKDEECLDRVGIFLAPGDPPAIRVELGPKVQTLTRAMTAILCQGFDGCSLEQIAGAGDDFVPRIVGAELMRQRSRTVYYILERLREAARNANAG